MIATTKRPIIDADLVVLFFLLPQNHFQFSSKYFCSLDKPSFNAKELNKTKSTNYIKQMYGIDGDVYYFWRDAELKLWEVTQRIEILLAKTK